MSGKTEEETPKASAMGKSRETLLLAFFDLLPVLFFGLAMGILGGKLISPLFLAGAALCLAAGLGKVLWKLILALTGKDIPVFGKQLRFVMPAGFLLLIPGFLTSEAPVRAELLKAAATFPSLLFFILAALGIFGMVYCAKTLDRMDQKANWTEQAINSLAQGAVLLGVLFL